uniref:Rho-GAP domain-containing protein n=1 Tax=Macrostomum lignano TaxID=282301 RepID=A0A1I8FM51_9PLAT
PPDRIQQRRRRDVLKAQVLASLRESPSCLARRSQPGGLFSPGIRSQQTKTSAGLPNTDEARQPALSKSAAAAPRPDKAKDIARVWFDLPNDASACRPTRPCADYTVPEALTEHHRGPGCQVPAAAACSIAKPQLVRQFKRPARHLPNSRAAFTCPTGPPPLQVEVRAPTLAQLFDRLRAGITPRWPNEEESAYESLGPARPAHNQLTQQQPQQPPTPPHQQQSETATNSRIGRQLAASIRAPAIWNAPTVVPTSDDAKLFYIVLADRWPAAAASKRCPQLPTSTTALKQLAEDCLTRLLPAAVKPPARRLQAASTNLSTQTANSRQRRQRLALRHHRRLRHPSSLLLVALVWRRSTDIPCQHRPPCWRPCQLAGQLQLRRVGHDSLLFTVANTASPLAARCKRLRPNISRQSGLSFRRLRRAVDSSILSNFVIAGATAPWRQLISATAKTVSPASLLMTSGSSGGSASYYQPQHGIADAGSLEPQYYTPLGDGDAAGNSAPVPAAMPEVYASPPDRATQWLRLALSALLHSQRLLRRLLRPLLLLAAAAAAAGSVNPRFYWRRTRGQDPSSPAVTSCAISRAKRDDGAAAGRYPRRCRGRSCLPLNNSASPVPACLSACASPYIEANGGLATEGVYRTCGNAYDIADTPVAKPAGPSWPIAGASLCTVTSALKQIIGKLTPPLLPERLLPQLAQLCQLPVQLGELLRAELDRRSSWPV